MTLGHLEDEKLHRYFDGELPEAEADEIRRALESSEDDRARLAQLERLSSLVRLAAEDVETDLESDALFDRIRAGVAASGEAEDAAPESTPAPEAAPAHPAEAPKGGLRVVQGEGRAQKRPVERWKVVAPVAAGLAIAAAVLLTVIPATEPTDLEGPSVSNATGAPDTEPAEGALAEGPQTVIEAPQGSEVVEVDFGANTGTVFAIEGDAGEPIAVVWINDEPMDTVAQ